MTTIFQGISADEYLGHVYEAVECPALPLQDEDFAREWENRFDGSRRAGVSLDVNGVFFDETTDVWLEETPAGKIPVLYTKSRASFERAVNILNPSTSATGIPESVNAFTIKARHPKLGGHRVILLNRAGYSAISGSEMGMKEEEWLDKSMTIRLNHEVCHYFSLRVLGGMQNHMLDEIAADCLGQLAAFGSFSASFQKRFFGMPEDISDGGDISGKRFSFYVKNLRDDYVREVLEETSAALAGLESYLLRNPDMGLELNRPRLMIKLLSTGLRKMRDLG